jgi:hypothetical protein
MLKLIFLDWKFIFIIQEEMKLSYYINRSYASIFWLSFSLKWLDKNCSFEKGFEAQEWQVDKIFWLFLNWNEIWKQN